MIIRKRIIGALLASVMIISAVGFSFVFAEKEAPVQETTVKEEMTDSVSSPADFKVSVRKKTKLTLKWKSVKNAEGYVLEIKQDGKYIKLTDTAKTSFSVEGLKGGNIYGFRLRAYIKDGRKKIYSEKIYLNACTKPSTVTIKNKTCENRSVTINWKKTAGDGYQLQHSTDKNFASYTSKKITGAENVTYTTKKLNASTTYYFRIRSYVTLNSKTYYSDWSEFSIKTDKGYKTTPKGYKIEVKNGITYVDGVLIANKTYSIPQSYAPGGLTNECNAAFNKMRSAAAKEGVNLYIVSGYRSYETQKNLYNRYVARDGKAKADTYSARPGTSEHQTGLAMDLNSVNSSFANTKEGKWLAANCHKYGFIIRYPKGKQSVTGYIYEPWHVRYLGVDRATKIYQSGLCLEEYYGITSRYN